ncbi:hypothetical protein [Spirosoma sp. KUDC1026]|uniref:hypothetical protein n=1 Tax=Spirosoma sp. KUDC1026 TaxID=2745947 RepID=UPI00159B8853|nr:hypothetical protein [Spirosoma sp. KUDC1026]QKZ12816.1 hypothetical protein HU175_09305 [Spirosoma sp. KUDC1026]
MKALNHFSVATALFLGLGLLIAQSQPIIAQTLDDNRTPAVSNADQSIVSAIAPYRDDVRHSILLASQQPDVLSQLAQQQNSSQRAFTNLIQSYGQTRQTWFYDLARFPAILHDLAMLPPGSSQATVQDVTKSLPSDVQESAWKLYHNHHNDLVQADNLNQHADRAFTDLTTSLDQPTQAAFRQLLGMPDVLTLLTQQIDKTAELGRAYQTDPVGVAQNLTDLHDKLDAQNQQELANYQRELNQDPQAQQELQQAGQAYAQANGYRTNGINPNPAWINTGYYNQNPYSYWFGYPYWYASPMWYPSAWWYGTGFYAGTGGNLVVFGLPSIGFSNWFFNRGYSYYPHLYNRFNTYYANNVGYHRYWSPGNSGFMTAAHRAFGPAYSTLGGRPNWFGGGRIYSSPGTLSSGNGRLAAPLDRMGSGSYRGNMRSYGGFSNRSFGGSPVSGMRSFGGGSFGGFHGGRGGR